MQISRHWRLNAQRYRLEGIKYRNGEVALQERPMTPRHSSGERETAATPEKTGNGKNEESHRHSEVPSHGVGEGGNPESEIINQTVQLTPDRAAQ